MRNLLCSWDNNSVCLHDAGLTNHLSDGELCFMVLIENHTSLHICTFNHCNNVYVKVPGTPLVKG